LTALLACRPMTELTADPQALGAAYHAGDGSVMLAGEPHSPERIRFIHGAMTGHAACACPLLDEHGHNVNPGRAPLPELDPIELDPIEAGRADGRRKAGETYARRRARAAADELALIAPALWDPETRSIVMTLATLAAPSRIDDVLDEHLLAVVPLFEPIECKHGVAGYRGVEACQEGAHDV
jgi:hypothetical protein